MEKLIIEATTKSPKIILDPDNDKYEIVGHSLPENVLKLYEPVLEWIDTNIQNIDKKMVFHFKVDYLNSASSKMVSIIFSKLEKFYQLGKDIQVKWFYDYDDDDIYAEGKIYANYKKLPIELVGFNSEG
jgi:hypothetical protein